MTLQSSGSIAASQINTELALSASNTLEADGADFRNLAGIHQAGTTVNYSDQYARSRFPAVTRSDNLHLTDSSWGSTLTVKSIASTGSTAVIFADYGIAARSTNQGGDFTMATGLRNFVDTFKSMLWAANINGFLYASLSQGVLARSGDGGVTWVNAAVSGIPDTETVAGLAWTGTHYVCIGLTTANIYNSTDGLNWTYRTTIVKTGNVPINSVQSIGGVVLVVNNLDTVYRSTDNGVTFPSEGNINALTSAVNKIKSDGTQFLVVGDPRKVYTSTDGLSWTTHTFTEFGAEEVIDIVKVGSNYCVLSFSRYVGRLPSTLDSYNTVSGPIDTTIQWIENCDGFLLVGGLNGFIGRSADFLTYAQTNLPLNTGIGTTSVAFAVFANSLFYVLGIYGHLYTSSDGLTYSYVSKVPLANLRLAYQFAVKSSTLVVGNTNPAGSIFYSTDNGATWSSEILLQPISGVSTSSTHVISNGTIFLVVQNTTTVTSTDGVNYTGGSNLSSSGFNTSVLDVMWTGTEFWVCGASGKLAKSTNGLTWTNVTTLSALTTETIRKVSFVNSKIFAFLNNGDVAESSDGGATWIIRDTNLASNQYIGSAQMYCKTEANGVGYYGFNSQPALGISTDGGRLTVYQPVLAGGFWYTKGGLVSAVAANATHVVAFTNFQVARMPLVG